MFLAAYILTISSALAVVRPQWDPDPIIATANIQAAINSGDPLVIIYNPGVPWIIRSVQLASNQTIRFEAGVVVQSDRNWQPVVGDNLFWGIGLDNLNFEGDSSDPAKLEFLAHHIGGVFQCHSLELDACQNVTIKNLQFKSRSGDGMYVGPHDWNPSTPSIDVTIENCRSYDCARCGLGVIDVIGLRVRHCLFENGGNEYPNEIGLGIDFEPDDDFEELTDILVTDCVAVNNNKAGFRVWISNLRPWSEPVDVRFENCHVINHPGRAFFVTYKKIDPEDCPSGKIEFVDCSADNVDKEGIRVDLGSENPMQVVFDNCTLDDVANDLDFYPLNLFTTVNHQGPRSGIDFVNCVLTDDEPREIAWINNFAPGSYEDIEGNLTVHNRLVQPMPPGVLLPNLVVRYLP
jgi:hypothetical protein